MMAILLTRPGAVGLSDKCPWPVSPGDTDKDQDLCFLKYILFYCIAVAMVLGK